MPLNRYAIWVSIVPRWSFEWSNIEVCRFTFNQSNSTLR